MKHIAVTICVLSLVAVTVSAYALPEEAGNVDAKYDLQPRLIAKEALPEGEILHVVSNELKQDDLLPSEFEQYFWRLLWDKTRAILTNAGQKLKVAAKEAKKQAKQVAKTVQRKASDKATVIMSKILSNNFQGYDMNQY